MEFIFDLNDIDKVAHQILNQHPLKIITFNGPMGAGKTTVVKAIAKALGVKNTTASPTFSLVNEYESQDGILYHFDVYRLNSESEALDFGIEEYFDSGHWCFIEWAEKIKNIIPTIHTNIDIKILSNDQRKLTINNVR
jgi:tRNA threonylcarbamoyladenosine biosynthesis protein TsaE